MIRKLIVVVVSTLVLCPQVDASTLTFITPPGGTVWGVNSTVHASGATSAPAGDKLKVSFGRYASGTEYIENSVIHTITGTLGPNSWTESIPAPSGWFGWFGGWKRSPIGGAPTPIMIKDHFVKVEDLPSVGDPARYRNDQGVM